MIIHLDNYCQTTLRSSSMLSTMRISASFTFRSPVSTSQKRGLDRWRWVLEDFASTEEVCLLHRTPHLQTHSCTYSESVLLFKFYSLLYSFIHFLADCFSRDPVCMCHVLVNIHVLCIYIYVEFTCALLNKNYYYYLHSIFWHGCSSLYTRRRRRLLIAVCVASIPGRFNRPWIEATVCADQRGVCINKKKTTITVASLLCSSIILWWGLYCTVCVCASIYVHSEILQAAHGRLGSLSSGECSDIDSNDDGRHRPKMKSTVTQV